MSKKYQYTYENLLKMVYLTSKDHPDRISHKFRKGSVWQTKTYSEFFRDITRAAYGLKEAGIESGTHVGFFANNRYEWIVIDMALMLVGAVSVPRGSDTTPKELSHIINHSEADYIILENVSLYTEIKSVFAPELFSKIKKYILIDKPSEISMRDKDAYIFFDDIVQRGIEIESETPDYFQDLMNKIKTDDLATIIYTSGTTGNPKGVMLTHRNFLHNVKNIAPRMECDEENGEVTVSILPTWHVYERTYEYVALSCGTTFVYSSIKHLSADIEKERPTLFVTVPRIWESIYQKLMAKIYQGSKIKQLLFYFFLRNSERYLISTQFLHNCYISLNPLPFFRKIFLSVFHILRFFLVFPIKLLSKKIFHPITQKLGGRLKGSFSGGGSLPHYIDNFFNSIGITLINAYGLTETSPGILSRSYGHNTLGTTGFPFGETDLKLLDNEGNEIGFGEKGILHIRGSQVMKGYYNNDKATNEIIDREGWLNTGDICIRSGNGDYIIVGRAKDTIVLLGGENVEPEHIEDKLKESELIDHAVVRGQDKKKLNAIIAINEDALNNLAAKIGLSSKEIEESQDGELIKHPKIYEVIKQEVNKLISKEHGFKPFEQISKILPLKNNFTIGQELTQSLKIKRKFIEEKYQEIISIFLDNEQKEDEKKPSALKNKNKDKAKVPVSKGKNAETTIQQKEKTITENDRDTSTVKPDIKEVKNKSAPKRKNPSTTKTASKTKKDQTSSAGKQKQNKGR